MNKTEFKVVSAERGDLLTERVNGFLAAGWSLQGPMVADRWGLHQPMTRETVTTTVTMDAKTFVDNADKIAKAVAKAVNGAAIDARIRSLAGSLNLGAFGMRIVCVVNEPRRTTPGFTREIAPGHVPCGYDADIIVLGEATDYDCDEKTFNRWVNDILRSRLNPGGYIVRIDK